jgi:hypothetical protein
MGFSKFGTAIALSALSLALPGVALADGTGATAGSGDISATQAAATLAQTAPEVAAPSTDQQVGDATVSPTVQPTGGGYRSPTAR